MKEKCVKLNVNSSYYFLTLFPAKAVPMKWQKNKTRDYQQKLNGQIASRIAERFRKLGSQERPRISGNEAILRLFTQALQAKISSLK